MLSQLLFQKHNDVNTFAPLLTFYRLCWSMKMKIPMLDLKREYEHMKEDIDAAIRRCLEHQRWILGPEVKELEDKATEYMGIKHCIGTSSGTEALVLALRALAIKTKSQEYFDRSDMIITTPFTFTATGDAILRAGATPLFVDIDPVTYNIDPVKIREALVKSKELGAKGSDSSRLTPHSSRFVGIIPVHLYGQSCQMGEIMTIAKEFDLFVVEDVAQAFGASWDRKKLGTIGTAGAFSFFPSKNLGGFGDAGMVSTNNDESAELVRMLLKHGGKDKYNVDHIGYNARLDTLQAAILLAKLQYIDDFNARRRHIARLYTEGLADIPGIVPLARREESARDSSLDASPLKGFRHVFHQYTIRVLVGRRDALQSHLRESGIDSMIYYPVPLHRMKVFKGRCMVSSPLNETNRVVNEVLSLPIEPLQSEEATLNVVESIRRFFA